MRHPTPAAAGPQGGALGARVDSLPADCFPCFLPGAQCAQVKAVLPSLLLISACSWER